MKTNYVLVDFENIQPENMGLLVGGPYKIKVFLGSHQSRIPLETARALQAFGPDVEYIQIEGSGKNALDFHIAYYIGRLAADQPDVFFHVISKDTGFDPLCKHLKGNKIYCQRSASIADIPLVKTANAKTLPEKVDAVIDNLTRRKAAKPRTLKTLGGTIRHLFGNQLTDEALAELITQLTERGVIEVKEGKVGYPLPGQTDK